MKMTAPDPPALPTFHRTLLGWRGNVTRLLEDTFGEPMTAIKLAGSTPDDTALVPLLEYEGEIMRRTVLLQGTRTGVRYVYAEALLAEARLPDRIRRDLVATNEPLGRLLAREEVATTRDLRETGTAHDPKIAAWFGSCPPDVLLWRSYRILCDHRPIAVIREWFPLQDTRDCQQLARHLDP